MNPTKVGVRPVSPGQTPVPAPGTSAKKSKAFVQLTPTPANVNPLANAAGSRRTPVRFPIRTSDAAAWALITLVIGIILIAVCVLLTLGAPS